MILFLEAINYEYFVMLKGRQMNLQEVEQYKQNKGLGRAVVEAQNVFKSIVKQSEKYMGTEAYVVLRAWQL